MSRESASHALEFTRKAEKYIHLRGQKADAIEGGRTCSVRLDEKLNKRFGSLLATTTGIKQTDLFKKLLHAALDNLDYTMMDLNKTEELDPPLRDIREAQIKFAEEFENPPASPADKFQDEFEKYDLGLKTLMQGLKETTAAAQIKEAFEEARRADRKADERVKERQDLWQERQEGESEEDYKKRIQLIHDRTSMEEYVKTWSTRILLSSGIKQEDLPVIMKELFDYSEDKEAKSDFFREGEKGED